MLCNIMGRFVLAEVAYGITSSTARNHDAWLNSSDGDDGRETSQSFAEGTKWGGQKCTSTRLSFNF